MAEGRQGGEAVTDLVSLDSIRAARERIRGVARVTPLVEAEAPAGVRLLLKCENLQAAGAFKIRGAFNMIARLDDERKRRGVITYSSGNHGQAVALAARLVGTRAVIVMPTTAPLVKVEGAKTFGAEVIFAGITSAARQARAEAEAAARGLTVVPPFDHPEIIAGQGTAGLEILEQCREAVTVLVPIGGGGLVSGIAAAVRRLRPAVRVIGVEPEGAAKMKASLHAGHPVTLDHTASIAEGLMPVRPGDLTFAHVRAFVDEVVTVTDEAIAETAIWLFRRVKLVAEPSGAAAAAALRWGAVAPTGPVVAILSGGNVSLERLGELQSLPLPPPVRPPAS
jgi:threonine dehydratase